MIYCTPCQLDNSGRNLGARKSARRGCTKVRDALTVACSRVVTLNINTGLMRPNCAVLPSPLCACTAITAEILNFVIEPELSGPASPLRTSINGAIKSTGSSSKVRPFVADGFQERKASETRARRRYALFAVVEPKGFQDSIRHRHETRMLLSKRDYFVATRVIQRNALSPLVSGRLRGKPG